MSVLIFKYQARQILCCNTVLLHILADQKHAFLEKIIHVFQNPTCYFFVHHFRNYLPHLKFRLVVTPVVLKSNQTQKQQKNHNLVDWSHLSYFSLFVVYLGEKVNIWLLIRRWWNIVALWDLNIELNSVRSSSCVFLSFYLSPLFLNMQIPLLCLQRVGGKQKTCTGLIWHKVH